MAEEFSKAVEEGLKHSKRIYFGKDRAVSPPRVAPAMEKSNTAYLPSAPMVYAVIYDPGIVDNPDLPSYQPYVHGKCDPPALIPLNMMTAVDLQAHCYLHHTAFVSLSASWRLHCISGSRSCDCLLAVPMGPQGSILGVEVSVHRKTYSTQLVDMKDKNGKENMIQTQDGGFLTSNVFTMGIQQIDGGSILSIKINWSQKIQCYNDVFSLNVPFTFPDFVNPAGKKMLKKEKIQINVNDVTGSELLYKTASHPLKEVRHNAGSSGFLYESEVTSWSKTDLNFSYAVPVSSSHISGGVLLESAPVDDFDQREMFCMYLSPGNIQNRKVFRKDIIFVMDISGSVRGKLIEDTKNALSIALSKLNPDDSFSIIAFNGEIYQFSTALELASKDAIERAIEWININFIAGGDTNILHPLKTAIDMLSNAQSSAPIIFLATDGSVEDERQICDTIRNHVIIGESISPRVYTLGIGLFCNHYFLRMLAMISRGQYAAALEVDLVEPQMLKLFDKVSSLVLANITVDIANDLDDVEVFPSHIPDLSSDGPLILSGRYKGNFPKSFEIKGVLADFSKFVIDMKIQEAKDIPIQKISARDQIEYLTAQAWFSKDEQLEQKVAKLSLQTGFTSEYTRMTILEIDHRLVAKESDGKKEVAKKSPRNGANVGKRVILLPHSGIGFGSLTATVENTPPGSVEAKLPEAAETFVKAAANCCSIFCNNCCCVCCIHVCTKINNQCAIAFSQLCVGLGCFSCLSCCSDCSDCCSECWACGES
ncbi:hypothetical protein RJT34_14991 [Clitoria ternatea]|uniref:VWFA domain-containing protein n=1 Tax=Clitoria ternatea TaxID=43366 RepID=A0AAN9PLJ4_CLITE